MDLPNYKYTDILGKEKLCEFCKNSKVIKEYIPDDLDPKPIDRSFFIKVLFSSFLIIKDDICFRPELLQLSFKCC